jgi:FKBP-type peptidyl-prolyl cis-trans isomerase
MKHVQWVGLALAALLISACSGSEEQSATSATATRHVSPKSPPVHVPSGPPPKEVVVKELVKGTGAVVPPVTTQPQVKLDLLYTAVKWNGELFEERQNPREPFEVEFGSHLNPGWEIGLKGMRVGGRRELIVPVSASWGTGSDEALVYVVDLIGLKKISRPGRSVSEPGAKPNSFSRGQTVRMSKAEIAKLPPLKGYEPSGPPPKHLEIIDPRKGSGPGVPNHDWVTNREEVFFRYIEALSYRKAREGRYIGPYSPGRVLLEDSDKGLALGFTGMKVGGRRVLIVPPKLDYPRWKPSWGYAGYVTVYVIDLVGMEPPPDARVEHRNRSFGKQG